MREERGSWSVVHNSATKKDILHVNEFHLTREVPLVFLTLHLGKKKVD
jgi:hypothetical protein